MIEHHNIKICKKELKQNDKWIKNINDVNQQTEEFQNILRLFLD